MPPGQEVAAEAKTAVTQSIVVVFLFGAPGTGKTYLANILAQDPLWVNLNKDEAYYNFVGSKLERLLEFFSLKRSLRRKSYSAVFNILETIGGSKFVIVQGNVCDADVLPQIEKYLTTPTIYPFLGIKFIRLTCNEDVTYASVESRLDPRTGKPFAIDLRERGNREQCIKERKKRMAQDDAAIADLKKRFKEKFQCMEIDTSDRKQIKYFLAQIREYAAAGLRVSPLYGPVRDSVVKTKARSEAESGGFSLGPPAVTAVPPLVEVNIDSDDLDFERGATISRTSTTPGIDTLPTVPPTRPGGYILHMASRAERERGEKRTSSEVTQGRDSDSKNRQAFFIT